jgi:CubicO group peptidase (beta-lactamase class C family)
MATGFSERLDAAIASGVVPGAVGLLVDRDGVTFEAAAGRRSLAADAPMSADTVFWMASMTKAITSVAALQLVEAGKLSLDGDLSHLLPEFAALQVLEGFDEAGAPRLRPARSAPTLRQLLTHTSGYGYGFLSDDLARTATAVNTHTRADYILPLLFDPGEGWFYGVGIDWAGMAIEAASGQRLDAYFQDHILGPLGMADTGFALRPEHAERQAGVHARLPDGGLAPIPFGMPENPEVLSGGGGLYGTAHDYGRFLRMFLNDGQLDGARVLSPETVAALGEVHSGPHRAGALASAQPALCRDFDHFPNMHTGWGLAGLIVPERGPHGRSAGSQSWGGLANTYFWFDRSAGKGGVLLTQILPFGDEAVLDLLGALEAEAYGPQPA